MSRISVETVDAPEEIRQSLRALSHKFDFSEAAGHGANGYTFFGINKISGRRIAVKYYYWGGDERFHAEPVHLTSLSSPNIIPVLDAATVDKEWAYFVTDYCARGDLDRLIASGASGNHESIRILAGVLSGLTYLHGERLIHRDLKPQNIFLSDDGVPLIGDFGSVKALPLSASEVPGSAHSPLYRPPEAINTGLYGIPGDLYQTGLVLYQLLGGYLPYDETKWLNANEKKQYDALRSYADRSIYAARCLEGRIVQGKILDMSSLPPWVPTSLKRTIKKASNKDPRRRFQSASEFSATLHALLGNCPNWRLVEGMPFLEGLTSYRIIADGELYKVEKSRTSRWRRDNSLGVGSVAELVSRIEASRGE